LCHGHGEITLLDPEPVLSHRRLAILGMELSKRLNKIFLGDKTQEKFLACKIVSQH